MNALMDAAPDVAAYTAKVAQFYDELRASCGDSNAALDTNNDISQKWRHRIAARSVLYPIFSMASLLDVGCGHGDLLPVLRTAKFTGRYHGIDMNAGAIEVATARHAGVPTARFSVGSVRSHDFKAYGFDAVVGIGLFAIAADPHMPNHADQVWWQYLTDELEAMMSLSANVVVFNLLSIHADRKTPGRAYVDPVDLYNRMPVWMRFATVEHGYLPHEFMVTLRRQPVYVPGV